MTKRMLIIVMLIFAACGVAQPEPTGPPQQVPVTSPTDAGASPGTVLANTTEFCSVKILWNYTDQEISFKNANDRSARVSVHRIADDTLMVRNYLAPDGEDSEDASFAQGDEVRVLVEFLDINLSLDQWSKCDEKRYVLGK